MIIGRNKHASFLEDELSAQVEEFKKLLSCSAIGLLNERELYLGLLTKFSKEGEMMLMMPWKRGIPRKNEQYYCLLLPDNLRKYRNWGELTYKDLIKHELCASDIKCIWYTKSDNIQFALVGFNQVSRDFMSALQSNGKNVTLVIGPKVPPYEYLHNLKTLVLQNNVKNIILDSDYSSSSWSPILIEQSQDTCKIVVDNFKYADILILQGPPGTGKTYQIAQFCSAMCTQGKSVLVTALTNQALTSVAEKLKETSKKHGISVYKTALTTDESHKFPYVLPTDKVEPIPGAVILGTFYKMSFSAIQGHLEKTFDYVVVDEASQAFLATLAAASRLGKENMWVGDVNQMPPISMLKEKRIIREGYGPLIDGLSTIANSAKYKTYQLTLTHRLGPRGASYTGMFYKNTLKSIHRSFFDSEANDGPILVTMNLEIGDTCPSNAIRKAIEIANIALQKPKTEVAILSHRIETIQAIQQEAASKLENHSSLLIETVARVQGITKDVVIFLIPNTDSMAYCLEKRLFNVATSRARQNTFIIVDVNYFIYKYADPLVLSFLKKLSEKQEYCHS